MKTTQPNPLSPELIAQLKAIPAKTFKVLMAIDRASNIGFVSDEKRKDPAFMRRFRKFVRTGKS